MKNELLPYICLKAFRDCYFLDSIDYSEPEALLSDIIFSMRKSNVLSKYYITKECDEDYNIISRKFYNEIFDFLFDNKITEKLNLFESFELFARFSSHSLSSGNILFETKSIIPYTLLEFKSLPDFNKFKCKVLSYKSIEQLYKDISYFFDDSYYNILLSYESNLEHYVNNNESIYDYYIATHNPINKLTEISLPDKTSLNDFDVSFDDYNIPFEDIDFIDDELPYENISTKTKIEGDFLCKNIKYYTENITLEELIDISLEIIDNALKISLDLQNYLKKNNSYKIPIESFAPYSEISCRFFQCPNCNSNSILDNSHYCYNCGLKIDRDNF